MCFNRAKASTNKSSKNTDNRIGASDNAVVLRSDPNSNINFTVNDVSKDITDEAFDLSKLVEEGRQDFIADTFDLIKFFGAGAIEKTQDALLDLNQSSQKFAKEVIAEQNPNDANRLEKIMIIGMSIIGISFITWGVFK